jgi:hypothetical protein
MLSGLCYIGVFRSSTHDKARTELLNWWVLWPCAEFTRSQELWWKGLHHSQRIRQHEFRPYNPSQSILLTRELKYNACDLDEKES